MTETGMLGSAPYIRLRAGPEGPVVEGLSRWQSTPAPGGAAIGMMRGAWAWDGVQLVAEVDGFGFYSLFVYEKQGEVMVSPSLLELVAQGADTTRDELALAVFHRVGIFINDETPLKHVRVLPPGGRLVWRAGRMEITGGAEMPVSQRISRDDAVDGMISLFGQAVRRILTHCDGPIVLPLSGGRDSRHILLELLHQGRAPEACVTFHHNGYAFNSEAQAARALCQRAGIAHDVLGYARPRLADATRAMALTGLCADEHAQMMPLHDYFAQRDVIGFDGIAGDILTNPDDWADDFYKLAEKGDYRGIALGMIKGHGGVISRSEWGQGAGPVYSPGRDDEVLDHMGRAIAQYADAPDPYQMFWMFHRTRREINFVPQAILSPARQVFTPYLDPEFARFCLSLPYSVTKDQMLHDDAIARGFPEMSDIPYQEGFDQPAAGRCGIGHKWRNLQAAWQVSGALRPERRLRSTLGWVKAHPQLTRVHGAVYDLHQLCLDGLDATRARDIQRLAAEFAHMSPARLISDRLEARG